jgi:hypothetical protein
MKEIGRRIILEMMADYNTARKEVVDLDFN